MPGCVKQREQAQVHSLYASGCGWSVTNCFKLPLAEISPSGWTMTQLLTNTSPSSFKLLLSKYLIPTAEKKVKTYSMYLYIVNLLAPPPPIIFLKYLYFSFSIKT